MIRVIFFDIDDTLLSFSGSVKAIMKEGFAHFGLPAYQDAMFSIFEGVNRHLWQQIEQGTLSREELLRIRWNLVFRQLGIAFDGAVFEAYFRKRLFDSAVLEPGARELLEKLHGRYTLCVVSNGPGEQQMNRLRLGGIDRYFSGFFLSSRIGAEKPTAAFFSACFQKLRAGGFPDLSPEEVLIVGDSVSADMAGGRQYGMKTCLYCRGEVSHHPEFEADYVIAALPELETILL